MESIRGLFSSEFMPHGHCYFWRPEILWLHAGSDAAIAVAYLAIPAALATFVARRRDLEFRGIFVLFAAFILSCGMTHAVAIWTTWVPDYAFEGLVKLATAGVSLATAAMLWPLIPELLSLPSPTQLQEANRRLQHEVEERRRAEADLRRLNETLEERVRQRTAALEQANLELAHSNEELDSFAHIASHDLKEPIRGIQHLLGFLRDDCGPQIGPAGHELLDRIDGVVGRMQWLLDGLLDFASVGRAAVELQTVDLGEIVDRALDPLRPRIQGRGVAIRIPRPLPSVRCAAIRAEQVFANLLSNALKYTPEHGAQIEIGWAEADPGASDVRLPGSPVLYVRDNGIGIPENQQENIFRVFKRLHARDAYGGGAGVGLSIVRKIVDVSGGQIRVESAPGQGATFWFTFGGER